MIKKKITKRPPRIIVYGPPSVGKTTLASKSDNPVFICCEDGIRDLDGVPVWVFDEKTDRVKPETLDEFRIAIKGILADKSGYKTLVIDGLDALDKLVHEELCKRNPKWKGNIQHEGFGRGEAAVLSVWRELINELEGANSLGLTIMILGHSRIEKFAAPDGPAIDRYQLSVTTHKLGDVAGTLFQWADVVGFARFETMTREEGKRTIGIGVQGARVLHLTRTDSYDAKCRAKNAPSQVPMNWDDLNRVLKSSDVSADELRKEIAALVPELAEDKRQGVETWLASGPSYDELFRGLDRVKSLITISA